MSGKLDQSLDEILSTQRRAAVKGGRRNPRRTASGKVVSAAPAGGIQKTSKGVRNAVKATPIKGARVTGESKIMVSNLPKDVSEAQVKDYFQQSVGGVKRVEISYGPGGLSRGIAHVTFHHADGATKAFASLNGLLIDNRPVKVEVVVANADLIPLPKSLGQRITQKPQPKSAAIVKHGAGVKVGAAGAKAAKKGPKRLRRTKKTAEELDSEMADYFDGAVAAEVAANGAAPPTNNGDATMDDEVL